jgi:hypothetical protein
MVRGGLAGACVGRCGSRGGLGWASGGEEGQGGGLGLGAGSDVLHRADHPCGVTASGSGGGRGALRRDRQLECRADGQQAAVGPCRVGGTGCRF